jgi:hypothetical protein
MIPDVFIVSVYQAASSPACSRLRKTCSIFRGNLLGREELDDELRKHRPSLGLRCDLCQFVEVPVRIAKQSADRSQSLEVVCDIQIPGDAHAAVNLHGILGELLAFGSNQVLDRTDCTLAVVT